MSRPLTSIFSRSIRELSFTSRLPATIGHLNHTQSLCFSTTNQSAGGRLSNGMEINLLTFTPRYPTKLRDFTKDYPNLLTSPNTTSISVTDTAHGPENKNLAISLLRENLRKLNPDQDNRKKIIPHLTVMAHSKKEIDMQLEYFNLIKEEIGGIFVVRGNPATINEGKDYLHPEGYNSVAEVVAKIKKDYPDLKTMVAGYPDYHPWAEDEKQDMNALKEKIDAGAQVIITQHSNDNQTIVSFPVKCAEYGIDTKNMSWMFSYMPIGNPFYTYTFYKGAGIELPEEVKALYEAAGISKDDKHISDEQIRQRAIDYDSQMVIDLYIKAIAQGLDAKVNMYVGNNPEYIKDLLDVIACKLENSLEQTGETEICI